jgi:signal peptidase I
VKGNGAVGGAAIVVLACLLAVVIRTAFFETFAVTSASMEPTLLVGDYFVLSKYSYGYSRYSLPFSLKLFAGRLWAAEPQRGDVVVFRYPKHDSVDFVKRIVGLPGDRVQLVDDVLHINGIPAQREPITDVAIGDTRGPVPKVKYWRETLADGVSYVTEEALGKSGPSATQEYVVPPAHYFIIGDNRDYSSDSRDLSDIGYVPSENLVGRAQIIFQSMAHRVPAWQVWRWPTAARFGRWLRVVR